MPLDAFHSTLRRWFETELGAPSAPQVRGWPLIREGRNVLIAAPTGTGKTLAAFFTAIDQLVRSPDVVEVDGARVLPDEMRVLYISPLKALGNDVQKNLQAPLAQLREMDPTLPDVRVLVRTGDTPQHERAAMRRRPPHILVTTPESLYLLLTSAGGRDMLAKIRTVIVDEIHALVGDKRGSHLALSLERLEALVRSTGILPVPPASQADEPDRITQATPNRKPEAPPIPSDGGTGKMPVLLQRIGLSATQKPIDAVARFLVGNDAAGARRDCAIIDIGHKRDLDLAIEIPRSPLATVCEHEVWDEIYHRIASLVMQHTSTLVFVNTRMMAERVARKLSESLGRDAVASHHGSLARERRLDAEQRLKEGRLRALVATASLELGIDIGDVDLVIQLGPTFSIAQFLQRVGRAGHALSKTPKGRLFPLTIDEAFVCCALLLATRRGELDRVPIPVAPLDILAQQIVAETALTTWSEDDLFQSLTRAMPYADIARDVFDGVIARLADGRGALLHRDGVNGRVHGTKRARLTAIFSGGAIPDNADVPVILTPDDAKIGTVFEDFVVESYVGDIFQLGNTSWRIVKIEPGALRVADAGGAPPNLPFWIAEAPSHTAELVTATSDVLALVARASRPCPPSDDPTAPTDLEKAPTTELINRMQGSANADAASAEQTRATGETSVLLAELPEAREVAPQLVEYIGETLATLGELPSQTCIIAERFFDETGGTHIVVHAPFGGRIVRALGHAMRMALLARFGGEVQAATIQNAILISLGPHVSFPLIDLLREFVRPDNARGLLLKSLPASPMFRARWRHNITRSLLLERNRNGKRVPTPLLRMRADDALVQEILRETGSESIDNVPLDALVGDENEARAHRPFLWQTVNDCFAEAMDVEGALAVLQRIAANEVRTVAVDVAEPSPPARAALTALPYAFLDDAPLEERRTQAVQARHRIDSRMADNVGALSPEAVAQVREQAWPDPESAEQVHEALLWMGYVTSAEADEHGWTEWLGELEGGGRVVRQSLDEAIRIALSPAVGDGAWFATEIAQSDRGPRELVRGRLQALGPVLRDESAAVEEHLASLEREGAVMRTRLDGEDHWCDRRLLSRIHRYTLDRLRAEIQPVSAAAYMAFLAHWHHVAPGSKLEGPQAVNVIIDQLAGFEIPAAAWEASVLPSRMRTYRRDWLDTATLTGAIAWGRLWGQGNAPIRTTPIAIVPRADLETWLAMSTPPDLDAMSGTARDVADALRQRGPMFPTELERAITLLPSHREMALGELVAHGVATCDAFGGLRQLIVPLGKRRQPVGMTGRWTLLHRGDSAIATAGDVVTTRGGRRSESGGGTGKMPVLLAEFAARALLKRYGILFRRLLERERIPVPWRDIVMVLRALELRGDVRGGRFVTGFTGEQYGLPDAVTKLRKLRRDGELGDASPSTVMDPNAKPELSVGAGDPLNLAGILTEDARVSPTSRKRVPVGAPKATAR